MSSIWDTNQFYQRLFHSHGVTTGYVRASKSRQNEHQPVIVTIIGREIRLTVMGSYFLGRCPFHLGRRRSLVVDPRSEQFACIKCAASGDAVEFVSKLKGITRGRAERVIRKWRAEK